MAPGSTRFPISTQLENKGFSRVFFGLVFSGVSFTSWAERASLALFGHPFGHPSSDGTQ